jgi:hypothetical protein
LLYVYKAGQWVARSSVAGKSNVKQAYPEASICALDSGNITHCVSRAQLGLYGDVCQMAGIAGLLYGSVGR